MKKPFRIIYGFLTVIFAIYLSVPNPEFPEPPDDALQSDEPADTETPLRRGYFTDKTRDEVMDHYYDQFSRSKRILPMITYRLNYPPEESQTLIRDQTRSTFLEEIVHPFRESIFVNGFEPTENKDLIRVNGKLWRQKIIIAYYPSRTIVRIVIGLATCILGIVVIEYTKKNLDGFLLIFKNK
ncbi:hypothetical protein JXA63_04820 [Candidatus Woesebacteria bacterium]|nr:hypothetical protein [Candidatus Woesebacteria bacterium]